MKVEFINSMHVKIKYELGTNIPYKIKMTITSNDKTKPVNFYVPSSVLTRKLEGEKYDFFKSL